VIAGAEKEANKRPGRVWRVPRGTELLERVSKATQGGECVSAARSGQKDSSKKILVQRKRTKGQQWGEAQKRRLAHTKRSQRKEGSRPFLHWRSVNGPTSKADAKLEGMEKEGCS